jgi:A/G-specific adenine glycosylase
LRHTAVLVRDARGRILVEQRPREGLWAALWQPPALERPGAHASRRDLARAVGVEVGPIEREFEHRTTHRRVLIRVHRGSPGTDPPRRGVFERRDRIARLALANPHRGILLGAGGEPA